MIQILISLTGSIYFQVIQLLYILEWSNIRRQQLVAPFCKWSFYLADEAYITSCPMEALYHLIIGLNYIVGNQLYAMWMEWGKGQQPKGFKLLATDSSHDPSLACPHASVNGWKLCHSTRAYTTLQHLLSFFPWEVAQHTGSQFARGCQMTEALLFQCTSQYFTEFLNNELVDAFCCPSVALPIQKQRKEKMKTLTTFTFLTYATTIHPVSLKPQRVFFMFFNNAVTFILWSILKVQSTRSQFCSAYKRLLKQAPITHIKKSVVLRISFNLKYVYFCVLRETIR